MAGLAGRRRPSHQLDHGDGAACRGGRVVMVIFSFAETVYTPTVSMAIAGIPSASVLESFNIRQVTWTAGSGLGAFLGGTVYIETAGSVGPPSYWLAMAVSPSQPCWPYCSAGGAANATSAKPEARGFRSCPAFRLGLGDLGLLLVNGTKCAVGLGVHGE